jgi:protein-tyrosine phosphatase
MTRIEPHLLWVGHAGDGLAFRDLDALAVVQLAIEERPLSGLREQIVCRFPLLDGDGNDVGLLRLAIRCVAFLIQTKIPTLVCCGAGMSRSPAVVAAALALQERLDPDDSLRRVGAACRTDVSPGLWRDIKAALKDGDPSEDIVEETSGKAL